MEWDQDSKRNERIDATIIQSRAIIIQNNSIICYTNNAKHQQDHDRA